MRVFLSYAREDLPRCERLAGALREREVDVLWDRDLSPALDYADQIRERIRTADSFAVLLTAHSVVSAECRAEMDHAIGLGKRLLPVLGDADIQPDTLPPAIRKVQWCLWTEAGGVADAAAQMREAMRTNFELVPMHTQLLNRADDWHGRSRAGGLLLRDPFLKEAEDWLMRAAMTDQRPQPTDLQREYLSLSRAAEIRNGLTFRRRATAGIVGLIGVVLVIWFLYVAADRNEKEATRQREAADRSATEASDNAATALRLKGVADENAEEAIRQQGIAEQQTVLARTNEELANRRTRTLLEERGRQELLEGRWDAAAVLLGEAFRMGSDAPALRLMLGSALLPLRGIRAALPGGDSPMTSAAFSTDGTRAIVGALDGTATVWEVATGRLIAVLSAHGGRIEEVHLNTDGSRALVVFTEMKLDFAEAGFYRTGALPAYVWDVTRSAPIRDTLELGDYESLRSAPHPLVTIGDGGRRFAFPNGREFRFSDGEDVIPGPAESSMPPDRATVVVPGPDNGAMVAGAGWHERPLVASVPMDRAQIAFRGESRDLVAVGGASTIRIAALDNGVSPAAPLPAGTTTVLSPDGRSAVVIREGTGVFVNLETGQVNEEDGWRDAIGAKYSLDGRVVLGWSKVQSYRFTFWAQRTPGLESVASRILAANYDLGLAAVSSSGSIVFADSKASQLSSVAWSGKQRRFAESVDGMAADPEYAEFSPDGRTLATALADGSIIVRDLSAAERREARLQAGAGVAVHLDFSRDSTRLAAAGTDGTARIWDLTSGNLLATCRGHRASVLVVRFSRDGHLVATAGGDGTARVWELPACRELLRFPGHDGPVRAVAFDADTTRLATADGKTVRVWELIRETRAAKTVAELVSKLSPACLLGGVLGRWTRPAVGQTRGQCTVK